MDDKITALLKAGNELARSIGHTTACYKGTVFCNCGAGKQQAAALDKWIRLAKEVERDVLRNS